MTDNKTVKIKLLTYLKDNKIRKDWLADQLSKKLSMNISKAMLSHYLHGRRGLGYLSGPFTELTISEILELPTNELF